MQEVYLSSLAFSYVSPMKFQKSLRHSMFVVATVLFSQLAIAHASLANAVPAPGATLDIAPKDIDLTFNERIEAAFSAIKVKDRDGKDVTTAKAQMASPDGMTLRLEVPALPPGSYSVEWAAVGHDGHRRTGDFQFSVK